ncbi:MAG TPA: DUF6370 family protein [Flavobacterium sp.]|jgi:hypothetical protein|uniref:DUF6370 family protein n=1 Tax=Flavobacterium sp. TaxID=239 RepID=UPI002C9D0A82|nr:DUF6370 family protein [Flavobacterium sp.]HPW97954.1 DUF6370 family protein [Flavobacterium sp.]HQA74114.1 DUF6370 family protein [Flavobacterium sp.]
MKNVFSLVILFVSITISAQEKPKVQIVEASCGQCQFGMKGKKGCDLAVRIDGKSYFVDGTKLDDHGDAHAEDGFCSAVRKAEVVGEVKDNKFVVSYFKLLPIKE